MRGYEEKEGGELRREKRSITNTQIAGVVTDTDQGGRGRKSEEGHSQVSIARKGKT